MEREENGVTGNWNPVPLASKTCLGHLVSSGEGILSVCSVCIFLASGLRDHLPTMCIVGAEVAVC